jgi:hypothetical protein
MIWQKASLGSQFERFLASEKWLKFLKKNSDLHDSLAQLVEQYTFNVWVLGSSPRGITSETTKVYGEKLVPMESKLRKAISKSISEIKLNSQGVEK